MRLIALLLMRALRPHRHCDFAAVSGIVLQFPASAVLMEITEDWETGKTHLTLET